MYMYIQEKLHLQLLTMNRNSFTSERNSSAMYVQIQILQLLEKLKKQKKLQKTEQSVKGRKMAFDRHGCKTLLWYSSTEVL
jgi:hypothetical protein